MQRMEALDVADENLTWGSVLSSTHWVSPLFFERSEFQVRAPSKIVCACVRSTTLENRVR